MLMEFEEKIKSLQAPKQATKQTLATNQPATKKALPVLSSSKSTEIKKSSS